MNIPFVSKEEAPMKFNYSLVRFSILLVVSGFLLQACGKMSSPTGPTAFTGAYNPTPTPIISTGVNEIRWFSASLSRVNQFGSVSSSVDVYFSVGGQAETTDPVTLASGGNSLSIPYNETVTLGGGVYALYRLAENSLQYQPGATYTLSTVTSAGTAWAQVAAPGGITDASNGITSSWQSEGTNDRVYVETADYAGIYDSLETQADVDSVFRIPTTAYSSSGSYILRTTCKSVVNAVNNAMPGSSLSASDELWESVSR